MAILRISLPEGLRDFVDEQTLDGGYASGSEFVRELIRREHDRRNLKAMLIDGASSGEGPVADAGYFSALRDRVRTPGPSTN
jgi:antitoxin ParD1/3/4